MLPSGTEPDTMTGAHAPHTAAHDASTSGSNGGAAGAAAGDPAYTTTARALEAGPAGAGPSAKAATHRKECTSVAYITPTQLFNSNINFTWVLLDTRSATDYASGTLLQAWSVPIQADTTEEETTLRLQELVKRGAVPSQLSCILGLGPFGETAASTAQRCLPNGSRCEVFVLVDASGLCGINMFAAQFPQLVRQPTVPPTQWPLLPSLVDDRLFLGSAESAWTPALYQPPPVGFGVGCIINVTLEVDKPAGIPAHVAYHQIKAVDDFRQAMWPVCKQALPLIAAAHREGHAVLVHCVKGASRSPTVVAAYLMHKHRLRVDDALTQLKTARPVVKPGFTFINELREHERELLTAPVGRKDCIML